MDTTGIVPRLLLSLICAASASAATASPLVTFLDPAPGPYHGFGWSITSVGSNILVGAPNHITGVVGTGDAYLYNPDGTLAHALQNPLSEVNDGFGYSVAAWGSNMLIGAPWGKENVGVAYAFDASAGHVLTLTNPTPSAHDNFGYSVAALGNDIFVGARGDDTLSDDAGAVYVFDGTTGNLTHTLFAPSGTAYHCFGSAIATGNDSILVGTAPTYAVGGAAYLYNADGSLANTFECPTAEADDHFGASVAFLGSNVLVGAPGINKDNTPSPGYVFLFDSITGDLLKTFESPNANPGDEFGASVAAVGGNVLIGANLDDTDGTNVGAAYLFDPNGELLQTFENPHGLSNPFFGRSVAAYGSDALVGRPNAYLFQTVPEPSTAVSFLLVVGFVVAWHLRRRRNPRAGSVT